MHFRVERGDPNHEAAIHAARPRSRRRAGAPRAVRGAATPATGDAVADAVRRRAAERRRPSAVAERRPRRSGRSASPSTGRRTPTTPGSTSPQANGWYDEAGVDLQILPYASTTPEALIAAGQAECGISFQDALTFAAAAGAPIVSVMAILQHTAQEIAVLASSDITRPRDLDGKTYAGFGYPNEEPTLKSVIKADGGTGTFKTVTLDTAAYDALYAKRADFVITFAAWEGIEAKERGIELRTFKFGDYGFPDFYQVVLACDSRWLAAHPDLARAFIGATVRGFEFAADDPEKAAALLVAQNPGVFDGNPALPAREPEVPRRRAATCATRTGPSVARRWRSGRATPASCSTRDCWPGRTASRSPRRPTTRRCSPTTSFREIDAAGRALGAADRLGRDRRRSPGRPTSALAGHRSDHAARRRRACSARCGTSAAPPSATSSRRWSRRSSAAACPVVLAIAAAIALDRWEPVRRAVEPLLVTSQTIPIVAIAPLFVIWFGFGLLPKVLIVVLVTFFPVTIALLDGFGRVEPEAMDLMRSMGATARQTFRKLRWPAALPSLFTGLRISVVYAVIGAIFGEYVGATEGLGIWMKLSQNSFRTDLVFAAILLTAVVSVALYLARRRRRARGRAVVARCAKAAQRCPRCVAPVSLECWHAEPMDRSN